MSNTSPSPNRWPALLLLATAVLGPPSAAVLTFTHAVTQNPWLTTMLIIVYELIVFVVSIIYKIWQRLEESWIKEMADFLDRSARNLLSGYYRHYCQYFRYEHRDIDMKGVSTQGIYTLDLERVFVELRIDPKPPHQASADPLRVPKELRAGSHTIWEYLKSQPLLDQHLVILGAPGSGKTTLLKFLGLTLLHHKWLHRQPHLSRKLPLLLFLRDHSTLIKDTPEYSLADAVREQVRKWRRPMPSGWIERRLQRGQCLILLDGLDEVADQETRKKVVGWVQQQTITYGKNRFVITSRPFGYRSNPLGGFTVLEVQPLTNDQVKQLVGNWYLANEIKSAQRDDPGVRMKAQEAARDLLHRLYNVPALIALAVNPLLLTMTATIHRYRGTLPGARISLYKEICEVFLGKRQEARGIIYELRADQRQVVLQSLAYHMMLKGIKEISSVEVYRVIKEPLQRVSQDISPQAFLLSIENTSGLLLEREHEIYSFAHLTFQEYLTAVHIRENKLEAILTAQTETGWWHETTRLYCAQADATPIIAACLAMEPPSTVALALALECAQEARDIQAEVRDQLNRIVDQSVEDANPERRRIAAEALLTRRLHQMLPLNERTYIDTSFITHAEYQVFLDEQRIQRKYHQPDHWTTTIFSPGQGQKPVLGVRASDAQAFCTWLTTRDLEGWQYRLPRVEERERENEQRQRDLSKDIGYWSDEGKTLTWAERRPSTVLQEQLNHILQDVHAHLGLNRFFIHTHDLVVDVTYTLDLARARDFVHTLARTLARGYPRIRTHDRIHTRNLVQDLTYTLDLINTRSPAHTDADDLNIGLAYIHDLINIFYLNSGSDNRKLFTEELGQIHQDIQNLLPAIVDSSKSRIRRGIGDMVSIAVNLYIILLLFQKRIEGGLPPYEGILLVKEHKQELG